MTPEQKQKIEAAIAYAREHGLNCTLCDEHTKFMVGATGYQGDMARQLGAAPGKNRMVIYAVCEECSKEFETIEDMARAVDAVLRTHTERY